MVVLPLHDPYAVHTDGNNPLTANWDAGDYEIATETLDVNATAAIGTLTLGSGSVTDSGGTINFGNEILTVSNYISCYSVRTPAGGLRTLDDAGETYYMQIWASGTSMTADRQLHFDLNNANRTIDLTGNPTLADWFDQAVKTTSSPVFDQVVIEDAAKTLIDVDGSNHLTIENLTANADVIVRTAGTGALVASNIHATAIGDAADPDLLAFAANALTVNGTISLSTNLLHLGDTAISLSTNLLHLGDTDTGILFSGDEINFIAGNITFLTLDENLIGSDEVIMNNGGVDVDTRIEAVGQTHALFVQGSDGKVGVRDNAPGSVFDVTGDINTTEQYKVDNVQVVGNQEAHIADADAAVAAAAGDPPTKAEFDALVTAYNDLATKFNTLLAHLDADAGHGLLAGAP